MDSRIALREGYALLLGGGHADYIIKGEAGRGGSSIVYDASYNDSLGNGKLVRIKECYPARLDISREDGGALRAAEADREAFEMEKERALKAYQRSHELFALPGMGNSVMSSLDARYANGTLYIVSSWMNGRTFARRRFDSLYECVSLTLGAARALKRVHDAGYLYLDLKDDNILTLDGSNDLVQLLDFDSVVSEEELKRGGAVELTFSEGFSPPEQRMGKRELIGRQSDIYSLGAVLFKSLWGRTPDAFDCDVDAVYDHSSIRFSGAYDQRLYCALTEFFHRTLANYHADRYKSADEAIAALREVLRYSDETRVYPIVPRIRKNPVFFGRERETKELGELLSKNKGAAVCLCGMGGIGKSALAREYCAGLTGGDTVIWLYDKGDCLKALADDSVVMVNTVHRAQGESEDEYLERKLEALRPLADTILLVIDDFDMERAGRISELKKTGFSVLLISRMPPPEGLIEYMRVGRMEIGALKRLFSGYSARDIDDEENLRCFESIVNGVGGHTLLTELIAREIYAGHMGLQEAEALVYAGFDSLPDEKIDYAPDGSAARDGLMRILSRLLEKDHPSEEETICLKLLSLIDQPGMDVSLFAAVAGLDSFEAVNALERSGWIERSGKRICLHPVMQEYMRAKDFTGAERAALSAMMERLYELIRPGDGRHDAGKQYVNDYLRLYGALDIAYQLVDRAGEVTPASQKLRYRLVMDAPVDRDRGALDAMLELLEDPAYLDSASVLRLYEMCAYMLQRLGDFSGAKRMLGRMKKYLLKHPSAYYLSAYYKAMAVTLHNGGGEEELEKSLKYEDRAIAAARMSARPDAKRQLAGCLLSKAISLMVLTRRPEEVAQLMEETRRLVYEHCGRYDYERYQFHCAEAMRLAMVGEHENTRAQLKEADTIAREARDSDLSLAEHMIEQDAPILSAMGDYGAAADAAKEAIALCDRNIHIARYREFRLDACAFLGRIYQEAGEHEKAEEAFSMAGEECAARYRIEVEHMEE